MMDEVIKSLFPAICIWLTYTMILIWWLKSDIRLLKDELNRFKATYMEDFTKKKKDT